MQAIFDLGKAEVAGCNTDAVMKQKLKLQIDWLSLRKIMTIFALMDELGDNAHSNASEM